MDITMIMAAADNGSIGVNNRLPWHLPGDLRYFVRHTKGKTLLMGRRTYESLDPTPQLPNPLSERRLLVVTGRPTDFPYEADDVIPVGSVQEGLAMAEALDVSELMVAGGHSVFMEAWPWADLIRLTRVHADVDGDTFMPEPDPLAWEVVSEESHPADDTNPHPFTFQVLVRRRSGGG
ncbi:dihydrofolate reductase [Thiohalorhabdus sp.]|uniref:dihydrofolate reductase n=1 Tax=Thiohalorhabdus sp. TaxID=3094134 RepID=UPI002FC3DA94